MVSPACNPSTQEDCSAFEVNLGSVLSGLQTSMSYGDTDRNEPGRDTEFTEFHNILTIFRAWAIF